MHERQNHSETQAIDLARISENNRGEPLTWGATPLEASPALKMQQDLVKSELEHLFDPKNIPDYVSDELADYIYVLNMSRTANRESHNQDSFAYREKMNLEELPLEALELCQRAISGHASPAELLYMQRLLGIPSIELTSLTHPYGQRIELLKHMRPAVNEAILLMGGRLVDVKEVPREYEVRGSDNPHNPRQMQGVHMTRKTIFGYLKDGTEIVERSSFVVLLDQLLPQQAVAIRAVPFENNEGWAQQVKGACELEKLAPVLLDKDEYEKAIPISTTVVAKNAELDAKLLSQAARHARQRQYVAAYAMKI